MEISSLKLILLMNNDVLIDKHYIDTNGVSFFAFREP